jgi:hypothetical protein
MKWIAQALLKRIGAYLNNKRGLTWAEAKRWYIVITPLAGVLRKGAKA